MHGLFADKYWKASITVVETLEVMNAWGLVDHTNNMNALQSTWLFKLKCFPGGFIEKVKALSCARGDQQIQGIDTFETYALTRIHLMLIQ